MLTPIELHHQAMFQAAKVDNEVADRVLATELHTAELSCSSRAQSLRSASVWSRRSRRARSLSVETLGRIQVSPHPSPLPKGEGSRAANLKFSPCKFEHRQFDSGVGSFLENNLYLVANLHLLHFFPHNPALENHAFV